MILSNLISCSSGDIFVAPDGDGVLDGGLKALAPVEVGEVVLDMIDCRRRGPTPPKEFGEFSSRCL